MCRLYLALILVFSTVLSASAQQRGVWSAAGAQSEYKYKYGSNPNQQNRGNNRGNYTQAAGRAGAGKQQSSSVYFGDRSDIADSVKSDGQVRRFVVHVPPGYGRKPCPVIIALHGAGMNIDSMRGLTLLDVPADQAGFMVVYPQGVGGGWNAGGLKPNSSADDVKFMADLLAYLPTKYNIDPRSIYLCGISNGGQMVEMLACSEVSRQIAAIGVVAITGYTSVCEACRSKRPIPTALFMGTEDPLVPREDAAAKKLGKFGESFGVGDLALTPMIAKYADIMTAQQAEEFWASHNGVSSPRTEYMPDKDPRDGCRVKRETYGSGVRELIVYTVEGGGHTWPGGLGYLAEERLGRTTNDINASQLLVLFFRSHTL